MTIIHQDLWWRKLVPSPYKRSELSNRVFCSFRSRKESICKWIPISNSLGKEAALVNVSISKGGLKCQRVVISDMPNWGDKVIRRYTGCTLQTFVKHYDSTISPPFFSEIPTLVVLECQSCSQFHRGIASYKSSCPFLYLLKFLLKKYTWGVPNWTTILQDWSFSSTCYLKLDQIRNTVARLNNKLTHSELLSFCSTIQLFLVFSWRVLFWLFLAFWKSVLILKSIRSSGKIRIYVRRNEISGGGSNF